VHLLLLEFLNPQKYLKTYLPRHYKIQIAFDGYIAFNAFKEVHYLLYQEHPLIEPERALDDSLTPYSSQSPRIKSVSAPAEPLRSQNFPGVRALLMCIS
jgi:hypothetical protein